MASIQIRNVEPVLIEQLKIAARRHRRTLSQEILHALDAHVDREVGPKGGLAALAARIRALPQAHAAAWREVQAPDRGSHDDPRAAAVLGVLDASD